MTPSEAELKQRIEAVLETGLSDTVRNVALVRSNPCIWGMVVAMADGLVVGQEDVQLGDALVVAAAEFYEQHAPEVAALMRAEPELRTMAARTYASAVIQYSVFGEPGPH